VARYASERWAETGVRLERNERDDFEQPGLEDGQAGDGGLYVGFGRGFPENAGAGMSPRFQTWRRSPDA